MERLSIGDQRVIERQLGRKPRGLLGVARRCRHGFPQVLTVYPLVDAQPFPTTYWLSCPFLVKAIDRLESGGAIRALERRLLDDAELRERVDAAHRSAVEERRRLLTDDDASRLTQDGRISGLMTRGIGGIADCAHLKCLHLHAAHALAGANPIGEIVLARLDATACPPQQVICSAD